MCQLILGTRLSPHIRSPVPLVSHHFGCGVSSFGGSSFRPLQHLFACAGTFDIDFGVNPTSTHELTSTLQLKVIGREDEEIFLCCHSRSFDADGLLHAMDLANADAKKRNGNPNEVFFDMQRHSLWRRPSFFAPGGFCAFL